MRGKWALFAVSAVLIAIAAGALSVLRRAPERAVPPVEAAAPALPPGAEISLAGKVEAQHVVPVPAPTEGIIEEYLVEPGEEVYEGQLLAHIRNQSLESTTELAKLEAEKAQTRVNNLESAMIAARLEASRSRAEASRSRGDYERAEKQYRRQEMLQKEGATPRLTFDKTKKEFDTAQLEFQSLDVTARQAEERVDMLLKDLGSARRVLEEKKFELDDAEEELASADVHSPVDGIVLSRHGEVGAEVNRSMTDLLRIATDLTQLQAVVEPEPPLLQRIEPGQPALVLITELGNESLPGTVKEIRGTQVIVEFLSSSPAVKPGITAQVRIKIT